MSFLYWVYDATCASEIDSGYVGVSEQPWMRLWSLRSQHIAPCDAKQKILFEGTREECLKRERQLRPRKNIGWNKGIGGSAAEPRKYGRAPIGYDWMKSISWHDESRLLAAA